MYSALAEECIFHEEYQTLVPPSPHEGFAEAIVTIGNWMFAAAPWDYEVAPQKGSVFVYEYNGGQWKLRQKLLPPNDPAISFFGSSMSALDGRLLVSAIGKAFVYEFNDDAWELHSTLEPFGPGAAYKFGISVALSPTHAAVQAQFNGAEPSGSYVYLYRLIDQGWIPEQALNVGPVYPDGSFGDTIAFSDDFMFVGSPASSQNGSLSGSVRAFTFDGLKWTPTFQIFAADTAAGDHFGRKVFVQNSTMAVTAPMADPMGVDSGAVYEFQFDGNSWVQSRKMVASNGTSNARFGTAVALRDDSILIGAPGQPIINDHNNQIVGNAGTAYLFKNGIELRQMRPYISSSFLGYAPYHCCLVEPQNFSINPSQASLGQSVAFAPAGFVVGSKKNCAVCPSDDLNGAIHLFEPEFIFPDCNFNAIPDLCETKFDCNFNLQPDVCDIASGLSTDCNSDGVPDECSASALYKLDNDDPFSAWAFFQISDFIWLNQYRVKPGGQIITHIQLPASPWLPPEAPVTLMVYADPNGDGNPSDAALLVSTTTTALYNPHDYYNMATVVIPATYVGEPGTIFFVGGFVQPINPQFSDFKWFVPFTSTGPDGLARSWRANSLPGQGDIFDLTNNATPVTLWKFLDKPRPPFMLRALGLDCNGNGSPDSCDIGSGASQDLNVNGVPDECEPPLCDGDIFPPYPNGGDGTIDVADLLEVINHWGGCDPCYTFCAGDINDDCRVNVADLTGVINGWGSCP